MESPLTELPYDYTQVAKLMIDDVLRKKDIPVNIRTAICSSMADTYKAVLEKLQIKIPVSFTVIREDISQILHFQMNEGEYIVGYAIPVYDPENTQVEHVRYEVDPVILQAYALSYKDKTYPFTPWKLVTNVAHELYHARQFEKFPKRMQFTAEPYEARRTEYGANLFALHWIRDQKARSPRDWMDQQRCLAHIRAKLKSISRERKKHKM